MPDWYLDCPSLLPGDEFYLQAFNDLSTERQLGQVVGPIPWGRIVDYAFYHELDQTMIDLFIRVIREMDAGFLDWTKKEQQRYARANKPKSPVSKKKRFGR